MQLAVVACCFFTLKMDVQGFRVEILAIRLLCKARVSMGVSDNTYQSSVHFRSECVTALVPVGSLGKEHIKET